jgi:trimeric autotransporter adhesin
MPNQFLSDEFGDIEDYFVTDYRLIDNFVGDTLWTWGNGDQGALGTADTTPFRNTPVTTFAGGTTWKQVSAGKRATLAIKTDGTLWGWGQNQVNEEFLGINVAGSRNTPVTTFAGGNNWKQVSASGFGRTSGAIKTDGTLWMWGNNESGSLGAPYAGGLTPVTTFAGGTNWKQVSVGGENDAHVAAIKTDGSLWIWGLNTFGQLGININGGTRNTPVTTFAGGNDWKQVSCGPEDTAAIKTDGSLWLWGRGQHGRLGNNNSADVNVLTPITTFAGGNNWKQVSCGRRHTAAIKTDGSLWTFGENGLGLPDNQGNRSTPVTTFAGGNNWKQVSALFGATGAIKTDGTLWIWGNVSGNNSDPSITPITTFAGGNNWKSVSLGYLHTAAIKSGLNVDLS